ncbi:cupin domain-containing protein [Amycolatopsis rhabdoformis]|uniref:Cupin domain-containing protein n=1 Tax=Amycolatopsis rhabdoformis TaxID=1448059 RepID=A0ABZ1IKG2_9PSEU|nr:cupin domain-containing protein [Amycolatopsis rhabdoformis]WSE34253.1 cupin domain-containing protein [Amycolatopsis rhabdoformis]
MQPIELTCPRATVTVLVAAGAYELFEVDAPRGPTGPPHAAPWPRAYYVLRGRMAAYLDGEIHDLGPGSALPVPPGAAHTFTVHTPSVQFLAVSLTDAMGRFLREADLAPPGTVREVAARHGVTVAGWPS